jgi:hypothetical protein
VPDLAAQLRDLIDTSAEPVSFEEIAADGRQRASDRPPKPASGGLPQRWFTASRSGRRALAAAVLVAALAVAIPIVVSVSSGERIKTHGKAPAGTAPPGWTTVTNRNAGISISVPPGWQELPLVQVGMPVEVLTVGSAPRPAGLPLTSCSSGVALVPGAVYVVLSEYLPGQKPDSSHPEVLGASRSRPRPRDFAGPDAMPFGGACAAAPEPGVQAGERLTYVDWVFTERHRRFLAQVVITGPAELIRRGADALNTLRISPTSRPRGPAKLSTAEKRGLRDAFLGFLNARPKDAVSQYVDDFDGIRDVITQAVATAPANYASYTGRVDDIIALTPTRARVRYSLLNNDVPFVGPLEGQAVKRRGEWKVSRDTVCTLIALGGSTSVCPPPSR